MQQDFRDKILQVFPTIIYRDNIPTIKKPKSIEKLTFKNGFTTIDKVLDLPEFKEIKTELEKHLKIYVYDILDISKHIEFYITRSWLFKRLKVEGAGETHNHRNSFFTGTLYLELDEGKDYIGFRRSTEYSYVNYDYEKSNIYNQQQVNYFPKKNDLIIFDAKMYHQVGPHVTNNERLALPFEVFGKGYFGKAQTLEAYNHGELYLK
tara:strand:- start:17 stop:637 length:621 start_codon:yes stop_codon:yes gene_type:complete